MIHTVWFRFVLLALFLFSYQTTAIHAKHHLAKEISQCKVCQASKHLDANTHQTSFIAVADITAVEVEMAEEKALVKEAFCLMQIPQIKRSDFTGLKQINPRKPALTYNAIAPPNYFS